MRADEAAVLPQSGADDILAISADAIISIRSDQRIVRFNRGAEEIFGWSASEVMGKPLEILLPERYRAAHGAQVAAFGRGSIDARRMGERGQIWGLRKSGEEFPAEASISRIQLNGDVLYTAVLRDVTERMRTEQTQRFLSRAGALLAGSLDVGRTLDSVAELAVPMLGDWCVVFLRNADGTFRRAVAVHADERRAAAMALLRDTPVAISEAHPAHDALINGRAVLTGAPDEAGLAAMSSGRDDVDEMLHDLAPRSLVAVPLRVRDVVIGGIACFFESSRVRAHNSDDLHLAEELAGRAALAIDNARLFADAQAAVRARDDVVAVVSHDLGNPLAAIRLSATVLLRELASQADPELTRQVENIRIAVDQMNRLIQDLLEIKRIESGYLSLEREQVSASTLLGRAVNALADVTGARDLSLFNAGGADGMVVYADPERIAQVFSNLIGNAAKFTPAGGRIEIGARAEPGRVVFHVSDNGAGIPAEHLPYVFDRFWQARRTGRHGVGLGLAIVKGIVDAHGGAVWVESEAGAGSTFRFALPAVK